MTDGASIQPDTKDWTWVLSEPCPECGYDAAAVRPDEVAEHIRRDADGWVSRLGGASVAERPAVTSHVWCTTSCR